MATELSKLMMLHDRGVPGAYEAACALGKRMSDVEGRVTAKETRANAIYQIYQDGELIMVGLASAIGKHYKVNPHTVYQWATPIYVAKAKREGRKYAVMLKTQK